MLLFADCRGVTYILLLLLLRLCYGCSCCLMIGAWLQTSTVSHSSHLRTGRQDISTHHQRVQIQRGGQDSGIPAVSTLLHDNHIPLLLSSIFKLGSQDISVHIPQQAIILYSSNTKTYHNVVFDWSHYICI